MYAIDGATKGFRDLDGSKTTGDGGTYAYTMTGDGFGSPWGGYLGIAGYMNTGTTAITAKTVDVYVADPSIFAHVTRDESLYGAPNGPFETCIADGMDSTCSGTRTFQPGAYKVNLLPVARCPAPSASVDSAQAGAPLSHLVSCHMLSHTWQLSFFGYTYGENYTSEYASHATESGSWKVTPDHLGLRVKLTLVSPSGDPDPIVTFNNGQYSETTISNNDVTQMSIRYSDDRSIDYTFPTNFRYGTVSGKVGGDALDVEGGSNVKIKAHHFSSSSNLFYLDFLVPIGDAKLNTKEQYFIYDPDVTSSTVPPSTSPSAPPSTSPSAPPATSPSVPPGAGGDAGGDAPCFAAETSTACKLLHMSATAEAAYDAC